MSQTFPTGVPNYPDTTGGEVLGSAGGGIGLSRILDDYGLDITGLATKIGTGASTPSAGKVLRANGSGTSVWGAVDLTADVTGTLPTNKGGTGTTTLTFPSGTDTLVGKATTDALTNKTLSTGSVIDANVTITEVLKKVYPVGCIYVSTNSTNPATSFGFGTWTAFGAGSVPVGFSASDVEFDTDEETGGAKTHTLTTAEMPSHIHGVYVSGVAGSYGPYATGDSSLSAARDSASTGGGGAHNNLQPYIVVRMWKRTA